MPDKAQHRMVRRKRRHVRLRQTLRGGAERPRLTVFRSAKHIYVQAIDDAKGQTLAAASTCDKETRDSLGKLTGNKSAAAAVGKVIAERLTKLGVTTVVFDRGGNRYHGRIKSLADAAREGGLRF